ncbi:MAG: triose-phosphate isomerase [Anaerolineales bacterium]
MARLPLVAGNWKMNKTIEQTERLLSDLVNSSKSLRGVEILVCPPFTSLETAARVLKGTQIKLGAQNLHWETSGAYTGEVSPVMLAGICEYVIIGHSERRAYFGETDQTVNLRVKAALAHDLTPIVCVGETLEQNEAGQTAEVVSRQVRMGLADVTTSSAKGLVVAYEPVWAIGTGKAATPDGASDVIEVVIRPALEYVFDEDFAQATRVLYGGSLKPGNSREFFDQPEIDGGLVGGASLNADDFTAIIRAAA